ncbi:MULTISPECIES: glycosyltransferase family 2 protein [unclassified Halomonas]|uniref:glycosyltransferase family 2 protein n=1 Tax=unclassified Halomonas TaxID=2609666 RepID=UPI00196A1373|nr:MULTISPECIES: glycosyltransferase family 2 protein [unclassified Halomonas]MBT2787218.1 glycosyltransferase family 2 protein [Halomonas sp. ISL-106]MBT2796418.1 glycosyltransferase family 2 protein [Halomonas sp. ISL-104]
MENTLSLIVPVFNEEESIAPFLEAIDRHLAELPATLEILFIDDGSSDRTIAEIKCAQRADPRVRYIKLSRNFGKEAAMTAGLDHASGDAVIPMDVDLQDPPELIHEFFRLWQEGYDTVYGMRRERNEDTPSKRASAGLFYRVFNWLSHTEIPANTGDYRLMSRRVVDALKKLPERNRFMKGLFAWPGYRSIGVEYSRPARHLGHTKWNTWKLWNFALDGLTSFSTWPLRVWSYVGICIALLSLVYMIFIIARTLMFGVDWPGYASIMSAILFFGSVQLISIGVLGEYVGRLYIESKERPVYLTDDLDED